MALKPATVFLPALAEAALLLAGAGGPAAAMSRQAAERAVQLQVKHDWQGLAALARQAIAADRKDGYAWLDAGLADDGLGRKQDAVAAYETAYALLSGFARDEVVQVLAQDYAALGETSKLVALYQQLAKSDPQQARAVRLQFQPIFAKALAPPPAATLPNLSPQTLAAMTAEVRRTWQADAVPVTVSAAYEKGEFGGGTFRWTIDYYAPATRDGLMVTGGATGTSATKVSAPNWGTAPIPANFLSLAASVARVPGAGAPGVLQHAVLYRTSDDASDPTNLEWDLAIGENNTQGAVVLAAIMPKAELDALAAAAGNGDARAQYSLAEVYATGVGGTPDLGQSVAWLGKAASQGDAQAENKLGQYYQLGIGVKVDAGTAASWYGKAAAAGFAPAEFNLGLLHETGLGVPQDWIQADRWITAAAKQGLQPAIAEMTGVRNAAQREQHEEALAAAQQRMQAAGCGRGIAEVYDNVIGRCVPSPAAMNHMMFLAVHPEIPPQNAPW